MHFLQTKYVTAFRQSCTISSQLGSEQRALGLDNKDASESIFQIKIEQAPFNRYFLGKQLIESKVNLLGGTVYPTPNCWPLSNTLSGGSRIFPRGGREPSRGGVNTPNFPENCMKSKEFGRPGGGVRPSRPPLDPPMTLSQYMFALRNFQDNVCSVIFFLHRKFGLLGRHLGHHIISPNGLVCTGWRLQLDLDQYNKFTQRIRYPFITTYINYGVQITEKILE